MNERRDGIVGICGMRTGMYESGRVSMKRWNIGILEGCAKLGNLYIMLTGAVSVMIDDSNLIKML